MERNDYDDNIPEKRVSLQEPSDLLDAILKEIERATPLLELEKNPALGSLVLRIEAMINAYKKSQRKPDITAQPH